ncbi:hypothetical protein L210DRAFT_3585086 [Boletus edulis BED1]|uniref:Uncharacterized protein n=1 Tax=Boletus edulis BED1 TaxID=1328754 RepID=A0AAD4BBH0_BOLED|nr:hypothetical protein L210DRAFT_3585086 [Boletus edulis BED1]
MRFSLFAVLSGLAALAVVNRSDGASGDTLKEDVEKCPRVGLSLSLITDWYTSHLCNSFRTAVAHTSVLRRLNTDLRSKRE